VFKIIAYSEIKKKTDELVLTTDYSYSRYLYCVTYSFYCKLISIRQYLIGKIEVKTIDSLIA